MASELNRFLNRFDFLRSKAAEAVINHSVVSLSGKGITPEHKEAFSQIGSMLIDLNADTLWLTVDGDRVDQTGIGELECDQFQEWKLRIHQDHFPWKREGARTIVFLSLESFREFLSSTNPFLRGYDLYREDKPVRLLVRGLQASISGPMLSVAPLDPSCEENTEWPRNVSDLPGWDQISRTISSSSDEMTVVRPDFWFIDTGAVAHSDVSDVASVAAAMLCAALTRELMTGNRIKLAGLRTISPQLIKPEDKANVTIENLAQIARAVEWAYTERPETRIKLLADRLAIEIGSNESFVGVCLRCIDEALQQATEEYGFVVAERKDAYVKELRDLTKELKGVADAYADRVRGVLTSLLRDILASFFLAGIAILPKISSNGESILPIYDLLLHGIAIYFGFSFIIQLVLNQTDLALARSELNQWVHAARSMINKRKTKMWIDQFVRRRSRFYKWWMFVFATIYLIAGILFWNGLWLLKTMR